eukprot:scaffold3322_cov23-Cyclotella_meneghiniana.AAC.1
MSWKFCRGKAVLKSKEEVSRHSLSIPQSDGTTAVIPLEANHVTKKTLGVWSNPLNRPTVPLEKLKTKGLDWVDKLRQYPGLFYGLSSLYASPDELEQAMGSVYFNALPFLGFNRNINKAYRTLPSEYQGIGLKHWCIEKLGKDISVLLRHWQSDSTLGMALQFVYEAFVMEIRLDGNYADKYDLSITFAPRFNIGPSRVGDVALMDIFLAAGYSTSLMESLNRCRRFKCAHSLSDVLFADGKTINYEIFSDAPGESTSLFSWEQPTRADQLQWKSAILDKVPQTISRIGQLGKYICQPHKQYKWLASRDREYVYRLISSDEYGVHKRDYVHRITRSGSRYNKISAQPGQPSDATLYASAHPPTTPDSIILHSTCDIFHKPTNPSTFMSCLSSYSNQSLWKHLEIDGDGDWLIKSILQGTLLISMDGSYMSDLSQSACSGAFILHCTESKQEMRGCLVDESHQAIPRRPWPSSSATSRLHGQSTSGLFPHQAGTIL